MDRCRAEVDLSRLKKNFETIKGKCDDVFAVVKANAYGHGATEVAKTLEECGCKKFAVASVYEAESLRKNGINGEIAILGFCEDFGLAREIAARPLVYDEHTFRLAKKYDAEVFVKINTGMNRLGFSTIGETASAVKNLRVLGVFTHLSSADGDDATDRRITEAQIKNFMEAELVVKNEKDVPFYAENSAALIKYGRFFDGARIGIALYGVNPVSGDKTPLLPVMTFRAAVIAINTVKKGDFIGYSRGYRAKKRYARRDNIDRLRRRTPAGVVEQGNDFLQRAISENRRKSFDGQRCRRRGRRRRENYGRSRRFRRRDNGHGRRKPRGYSAVRDSDGRFGKGEKGL